jgi:hypothetical protein
VGQASLGQTRLDFLMIDEDGVGSHRKNRLAWPLVLLFLENVNPGYADNDQVCGTSL